MENGGSFRWRRAYSSVPTPVIKVNGVGLCVNAGKGKSGESEKSESVEHGETGESVDG